MFYVGIGIILKELHGLSALDERRRLGLPDGTDLYFSNTVKKIEVGEDFARLYPSYFQDTSTVYLEVPHSAIMKGEVAKTPGYVHTFHLECLSLERCKWLFMKFKEEKK